MTGDLFQALSIPTRLTPKVQASLTLNLGEGGDSVDLGDTAPKPVQTALGLAESQANLLPGKQ